MTPLLDRLRSALAGRYAVEREIGHGGTATVFLAEDLKHGRRVAVKVFHPELAANLGADRFLREIEVAARLNHPHILPLFDSGAADGLLYYVMPFVEGESLRERLRRETRLRVEEAVRIVREVAAALEHAHAQGLVHRDVKPANILLSAGEAVVADFGVAKAIHTATGVRITATGLAVGTPAYMSPEQASGGQEVDARTDVYALGCVLYEMLSGVPPFTGPTPQAVLARKASGAPVSLRRLRREIPPALAAVVEKALALSPADRFHSASELAAALRTDVWPQRRRKLWLAAGAVALLLVVLAGWLFGPGGKLPVLVRPAAASFFEERGQIVVADFENETDESALGLAIREAVLTDLDQSEYVRVVERGEMTEVLERMGQSPSDVVDEPAALEIARRQGYPAVLAATVAPVGTGIQVSARLLEAASGHVAIRLRETARDESQVLDAVERLSRQIRRHLGESIGGLRRSEPLPKVTTQSLEALELYARAVDIARRGQEMVAIPMLRRVLGIDSSFAAAHRALGIYYSNTGDPENALVHSDLAYRYRDRLQPGERDETAAIYHTRRGRLDSAAYYYARALDRDPDHPHLVNNRGDLMEAMGRYEEALSAYRRAVQLRTTAISLFNLASAGRVLWQPRLADSAHALLVERYPNTWYTPAAEALNAYYDGRFDDAERVAAMMSDTPYPWLRSYGRWLRASLEAMHGRVGEALALADSAAAFAIEAGSLPWPYQCARVAVHAALAAGAPETAIPILERIAATAPIGTSPRFVSRVLGWLAEGHAHAGNDAQVQRILAQMDSLASAADFHPPGSTERVRAVLALRGGRPAEGLEHLDRARAAEFGRVRHPDRLLLGDAYAALGRHAEAAAQYDSLSRTFRLYWTDVGPYGPLRPLAHERAAASYLALGDTARAAEHLAAFVSLWEGADPELVGRVTAADHVLREIGR